MSDHKEISASIYGWDLYRVFRDEKKNIIKIVLEKDNAFREYSFESQAKWIGDERVVKK